MASRGRRVPRQRLVVRRVAPGSVARVVAIFSLCLWVVLVVAGVVLWQAASATGLLDNLESFWAQATGQTSVDLDGGSLLVAVVVGGLVLVGTATLLWALGAWLLNAIWDLTGGIAVDSEMEVATPPSKG